MALISKLFIIAIILFFLFGPWGIYPKFCLSTRCVNSEVPGGGGSYHACAWYVTKCPGIWRCTTNSDCKKGG